MDRIADAFHATDRTHFLPLEARGLANADTPIAIGYGQTNSQPSTVAMMLQWLNPEPGQKVLDVGSGSGWTTALLSHLVGPAGHVYAVERVPELVEFGRHNVETSGITNADFFKAGDEFGLPDHEPYDRILVSAAADALPQELLDQLKSGGTLVIPVGSEILVINKDEDGTPHTERHPGFSFVPLVKS
jgi:protein-L-isoaspartate(D-aspartate) O-methyltransferase